MENKQLQRLLSHKLLHSNILCILSYHYALEPILQIQGVELSL